MASDKLKSAVDQLMDLMEEKADAKREKEQRLLKALTGRRDKLAPGGVPDPDDNGGRPGGG